MTKFSNFNSSEYRILKDVFEKIPMMDTYIANIIEEYIYSTVREYYPDGSLKREYRTKYGLKDGEYKEWWKDGQIYIQTTYVDDEIHGIYKGWHINGNIACQLNYINGKRNGELKSWWFDGKKFTICNLIDGKLYGEYKQWDEYGRLTIDANYIDGERVL
jgi:antitoxin component YwqK of YwqJK toxin-antitoxin module